MTGGSCDSPQTTKVSYYLELASTSRSQSLTRMRLHRSQNLMTWSKYKEQNSNSAIKDLYCAAIVPVLLEEITSWLVFRCVIPTP
jgi:hypothetical protein